MRRHEHGFCLLLGSNIQPEKNLAEALERLGQMVKILQISSVWETPPVGSAGPDFLNLAALVTSPLEADMLREKILRPLEAEMGRVRTADKNAPRPIDIDIILADSQLLDANLFHYAHRAVPVAELLPEYRSEGGEALREAAFHLTETTPIHLRSDVQINWPAGIKHLNREERKSRSNVMNKNPLLKLESFGQSIWLDYLRRGSLHNGEFEAWVKQDGVSGATSNPSIFEKAFAESKDYDEAIQLLTREGCSSEVIYQALAIEDIQDAADLFRPTYDRLEGADGFISLEVSPQLAHDTAGTIAEARRLWGLVQRPNLFIKVPGTREGLPAIQELIGEGINVNITLLFGLPRYQEVAEAYLSGLETLSASGKSLRQAASVASFFLSRIDVLVDPMLEKLAGLGGSNAGTASHLHGQVAIASAKVASLLYQEIFGGERFHRLAQRGARPQRLLWASTGTKNPEYSDVKYVEALIGADTINTVPVETLNAYRDHGRPALSLAEGTEAARQALADLRKIGIDLEAVTQRLEDEGVAKFIEASEKLMAVLRQKQAAFQSQMSH